MTWKAEDFLTSDLRLLGEEGFEKDMLHLLSAHDALACNAVPEMLESRHILTSPDTSSLATVCTGRTVLNLTDSLGEVTLCHGSPQNGRNHRPITWD